MKTERSNLRSARNSKHLSARQAESGKEVKILNEIQEKRQRNIKYFFKNDGTYEAAIYPSPVHYLSDGKYKDIDNNLVDATDELGNAIFENKDNDYKVRISKNIRSKKLVRVIKDKYELSWNIKGIADTSPSVVQWDKKFLSSLPQNDRIKILTRVESAVDLKSILPGIDVKYQIKSTQFKENIIINQKTQNPRFIYNLYVNNLGAKLLSDRTIVFYDEKDEAKEIFIMRIPFMIDSKQNESRDISVSLAKSVDGYIMTIIPDNKWLNNSDTVYPITIDPYIQTSLDPADIFDNHVSSNLPDTNFIDSILIKAGYGSASGHNRTFIKFKLPNLTAAETIFSANLSLYLTEADTFNSQIDVHRVIGSWETDKITWNNKPQYDESKIEEYQIMSDAKFYNFDITGIVKDWYNSGTNNGFMLKRHVETSSAYNVDQFCSSDTSYSNLRPQITIMYVNNSGLEGYWTYHSQDVGRAGTGHVNDYTGNLVFIHNDLSMNGNRMPVTINHIYNSNDKDITIGYGYGWRLNLTQTVKWESIGGVDYFTHTDEDGTKHYYKYDSEKGYYVDDAGTDFSLTISGSGSSTIHTIKDKGGNRLNFDYNGYLKTIEDKNGNKIILTYDANDKLIKVEDGAGRATILNYNEWGYLLDITDPAGRRTDYRYTGAQLTTITYTYDGSKVTTYTYDGTNNLTSAINYDGYKMNYSYYDILTSGGAQSYRVKKVQETHTNGILGQEINISYGKNTTTFIDHMGERNIYQFNYLGNTVSSKDADNNGSYYKYYTPEERKNMLELDSKLQKTVINLLKNHNMEISGSNWAVGGLGGSTGSGSFTTADKYIGNQSLKIIKTNNADRHYFSQSVTLEKGKTYTLSGYVKTNNVSNTNGKGAVLYVTYQSASGEWLYHDSNYISGTNDWQRIEVTFTLPSDVPSVTVYVGAGIYGETGEAYFDNLQLEEGFIANRYNLIENSSLEGGTNVPLFWNRNPNLTADDTVSISEKIFGSQSFKINGESGWLKSIYQVVKVSGKKDDTIVASGWAKADSVPLSSNRNFAIYLGVTDPDGNTLQNEILKFNPDTTDWQYMTNIIKTKGDYVSITIYLIYYDNDNSVYFDGIQMYKEEFGQSYQYDANGNLKSITDLAKQTSTFEYNGDNDLIKAIDPKGGNFTYEYSADGRRNITKATSAENVVYSFDYDDYGNPKTARVGESMLFMESSARYTLSGNYLKSLTDGQGNSIINHYDEAKGVLNSVTDANGNKIIYNYDAMNRLTGVSKILGTKNIEKFPLNINTTGNKGTNPIEENAVFDKDADGYSTFAAFEGTANLLSNSSFEGSTTGWTLQDWDNSTGKWRLSTDSAVGNNSIECYDSDGLMNGSGTNCVAYQTVDLSVPLTVQRQYTLSAYAERIGANKPELGILCYDASGAEIPEGYQNYAMTITENQWIRISHTFIIPAGTKSFRTLIRSHVKDNEVVRFDGVQLEEKSIATPYTAGVRPSSKAYYDLGIDKRSGTMSIWFKTIGSGERMIFGNEGSNGEIFNVYINLQNQIILNRRDNQGNTLNIITINDMTIAANQWYFVALKWQWNNNTLSCTLYINDSVYTGDVSDFKDFTGGITAIGSSIFSAYLLNGYLEQFTYTPNALSDADINPLYAKTMGDDTGTVVSSSYTYENDRIKTVAHNGFGYSFDYDFLGNNTEVYVGSQRLIKNTYEIDTVDEKGINTSNLLESEYGNGQRVGYQYDSLDRITARTYDGDVKYKYKYDGSGNLGYYEDLANGQKYRYSYDMADRLTKIVDNEGNYARLYYDKNNNPSKVTQRLENIIYETAYGHDKDNRLTEILYGGTASDNTKTEYFPLNGGTVGSKGTQPIEQTPVFENDENGQEVLSAYAGTKVIYDLSINKAAGSMSVWMNTKDTGVRQILANEGTNKEILNLYIDNDNKVNLAIRNSADVFINLITTSETINTNEWYFVALKWQFSGNILTCALYLNSKTYTASAEDFKDFSGGKAAVGTSIFGEYPLKGWVKRFSYSPYYLSENEILAMYYNVRVNYNYDTLGRMNRKTINTGLFSFATEYSYVPGTAVNSTTAKVASIKNNDGAPITYQYDANGNISRMTMQDGITIDYVYDELNELIREDNKVLNKTIIYSYDVGGNILTKTEYQYTAPGATPTVQIGNPVTYSYEDSNWKDKLTNYNGKDIGYDAIGNTTSYDGYTYEWEAGRQLKTITGNNKNISYKYNDAGIRIEKKVNGVTTKYYLLGSKVAYETDGTGKIYYAYDDGKSLVSMNLNGVEYYYIRNAQGDVTGLFDKNGTQAVSYTYDTWGKLISIKDQNGIDVTDDTTHVGYKNPYRYRGYRYDNETGLYYLQSRYYNPEWGRYINADSIGGAVGELLSHNVFAYTGNNPVNREDLNGFLWREIGNFLIGVGKRIVNVLKATFGAEYTNVIEYETKIESPPPPSPIRVQSGIKRTRKVSKKGDSSKPISVYAQSINGNPVKANAGLSINIAKVNINASIGLSNIGISAGYSYGNKSYNLELAVSLAELQVGLTGSHVTQLNSTTSNTAYSGVTVDSWFIGAVVLFFQASTWVLSPNGSVVQ